ncbi:MFS transporter [Pseudonocardia kunmingensis]|uniref:Putative proline/betaine transporter n=1 Tax=Pseudonocardia kunmingensis TaxID=630975 RepID=A0A543D373_9PSEU|nr:MFS transporter [Pseudonocardia kunmingensis]
MTQNATPGMDVGTARMRRRVVRASFIGTAIEWYDFYLYGTAAALIFNQLFFPSFDPAVGTIAAFGTFAAGFLARPIGGVVFGHFGDRLGRKKMLIWSLVGMGVATTLIGLLPTYGQIGVAAPILLIVLRLLQGFAVGGEWGGAVLMSVEHAEKGRRGLAGSWTQTGSPAGLVLSTLAFGLVSLLPSEQFTSWGWRLPFLFSAVLVVVGLFIRLRVVESPAFTAVEKAGRTSSMPLLDAIRRHPLNILLAIATCLAPFVNFYLFATFMLTYATTELGIERPVVLTIVAIAGTIAIVTTPVPRRCPTGSAVARCSSPARCSSRSTPTRSSSSTRRPIPPSSWASPPSWASRSSTRSCTGRWRRSSPSSSRPRSATAARRSGTRSAASSVAGSPR